MRGVPRVAVHHRSRPVAVPRLPHGRVRAPSFTLLLRPPPQLKKVYSIFGVLNSSLVQDLRRIARARFPARDAGLQPFSQPFTRNPTPETRHQKPDIPETQNPNPSTLKSHPYTLPPTPPTPNSEYQTAAEMCFETHPPSPLESKLHHLLQDDARKIDRKLPWKT